MCFIECVDAADITSECKVSKTGLILQFVFYIIIMVIFKCYFSREHIALPYKKCCEHRIRKNQQIKSTVHDGKSYLK